MTRTSTVKDEVFAVGRDTLYQLRAQALTPSDSGQIRTPEERYKFVTAGVIDAMEQKLADAFNLLLEHPVRRGPKAVHGGILNALDEDQS